MIDLIIVIRDHSHVGEFEVLGAKMLVKGSPLYETSSPKADKASAASRHRFLFMRSSFSDSSFKTPILCSLKASEASSHSSRAWSNCDSYAQEEVGSGVNDLRPDQHPLSDAGQRKRRKTAMDYSVGA